jgi:hypothetical protein
MTVQSRRKNRHVKQQPNERPINRRPLTQAEQAENMAALDALLRGDNR